MLPPQREARANKKALKEMFRGEAVKAQRRVAAAQPQGTVSLP